MDIYPHGNSGVWARVKNILRQRAANAISRLIIYGIGFVIFAVLFGVCAVIALSCAVDTPTPSPTLSETPTPATTSPGSTPRVDPYEGITVTAAPASSTCSDVGDHTDEVTWTSGPEIDYRGYLLVTGELIGGASIPTYSPILDRRFQVTFVLHDGNNSNREVGVIAPPGDWEDVEVPVYYSIGWRVKSDSFDLQTNVEDLSRGTPLALSVTGRSGRR